MHKEFHLLIDDMRTSQQVKGMDLIARTADQGLVALRTGKITHLYLDNDLGMGQSEGWEILEIAIEEGILPNFVQLVTSNPAARKRMNIALLKEGFLTKDDVSYVRLNT